MKRKSDHRSRILIVEPAGLLWGSERALLDLLSHIDLSRYDVTVACPAESPFLERVHELKIRAIAVPLQLLHVRGRLARLKALVVLAMVMIRVRPHVVHVNQAGVARLVILASLLTRARVLCHVRLLEDARIINKRAATRLQPTQFLVISSTMLAELTRGGAIDNGRVECIYDPLDGAEIRRLAEGASLPKIRAEFGISEHAVIVSMVGRVCEDKRQELLVDAALLARADAYYLIIGGDPPAAANSPSYRKRLLERIRNAGIDNRVIFTGMRYDVPALMIASDIVLLASEEEAFGRALLEALALGRHIIAPAAGGPGEIVGDDERGLAFRAGDARAMAGCIDATFADKRLAQVRTERGLKWVAAMCAPEGYARRIERIYDRLAYGSADR